MRWIGGASSVCRKLSAIRIPVSASFIANFARNWAVDAHVTSGGVVFTVSIISPSGATGFMVEALHAIEEVFQISPEFSIDETLKR